MVLVGGCVCGWMEMMEMEMIGDGDGEMS